MKEVPMYEKMTKHFPIWLYFVDQHLGLNYSVHCKSQANTGISVIYLAANCETLPPLYTVEALHIQRSQLAAVQCLQKAMVNQLFSKTSI